MISVLGLQFRVVRAETMIQIRNVDSDSDSNWFEPV